MRTRSLPADAAYCLQYFLKSFHFLFERLTSGRRNNGDASGVLLPSDRRKTEELLQQHRHKVHRQQDHWPGLQPRHTGERTEPRVRSSGVPMLVGRSRGLALGALPEIKRPFPAGLVGVAAVILSLGFYSRLWHRGEVIHTGSCCAVELWIMGGVA